MSELLKKATKNFDAAELLINNRIYPPSIHCSYYSCLQIILFLIKTKLVTEWTAYQDSIDASIALKQLNRKESLHNQYISFIKQDIKKKELNLSRKFSTDIGILKQNRNDSDYTETPTEDRIAENSLNLAKKINFQLMDHYKL